jgi:hypothetical protein
MSYLHYLWIVLVFLRLVYPMLTVSLNCPFSLPPSVISNVYLAHFEIFECILDLFRQCEMSCLFFISSDINERLYLTL